MTPIKRVYLAVAGAALAVLLLCIFSPGWRWYILYCPRYGLWRTGLYPYDKQIVYEGLNGDIWRQSVVRGKSLNEIRGLLHDITASEDGKLTNSVYWSDTRWRINLKDGRGVGIQLDKW